MPTDNNYWGNPQGQPLQQSELQHQPASQSEPQQQPASQSEPQQQPTQQPEPQFAQQQPPTEPQPAQQWQQQAATYASPAVAPAAPYQASPAQPQKSRGWIVAIVVVVCLFLMDAQPSRVKASVVTTNQPNGFTRTNTYPAKTRVTAIIDTLATSNILFLIISAPFLILSILLILSKNSTSFDFRKEPLHTVAHDENRKFKFSSSFYKSTPVFKH